jgi:hypothetical protein
LGKLRTENHHINFEALYNFVNLQHAACTTLIRVETLPAENCGTLRGRAAATLRGTSLDQCRC